MDSQVIALAPFSQNSNEEVCLGSGHAQPGQSNPSGWLAFKQRHGALGNDLLMGQRLGDRLERAPAARRLVVLFDTFWTLIRHVETPLILCGDLDAADDWHISLERLATGAALAHYTEA